MSKRRVFLVTTVDQIERDSTRWCVQGRAWEAVKISDQVYLDVMSADGAESPLTFQIMRCRSYGVDIPELSHDMTEELVLQGPHGDLLRGRWCLVGRVRLGSLLPLSLSEAQRPPLKQHGGAHEITAGLQGDTALHLGVLQLLNRGDMAVGQRRIRQAP
jgi:hypothetical protein